MSETHARKWLSMHHHAPPRQLQIGAEKSVWGEATMLCVPKHDLQNRLDLGLTITQRDARKMVGNEELLQIRAK